MPIKAKTVVPQYLRIQEVCDRLSVGQTLIKNEIRNGALKTIRIGRCRLVSEEELARYLAGRSQGQ